MHGIDAITAGEGHASTGRTRLIKVAAQIVVRARCIRVRLSGCWPYREQFRQVSRAILETPLAILLSPDSSRGVLAIPWDPTIAFATPPDGEALRAPPRPPRPKLPANPPSPALSTKTGAL